MRLNFLQILIKRSRSVIYRLRRKIHLAGFRLRSLNKQRFECPICSYHGPFEDVNPPTGFRKHAQCPNCGALERHRLQYIVIQSVLSGKNASQIKMLHIAPETFFKGFFLKRCGMYETADLNRKDVDHQVDLTNLPFPDSTFDFVFASQVLEHIPDNHRALQEIRRILKPAGMAVLPAPVVSMKTGEYPEPNPHEAYHVRAPGFDYFDKYKIIFQEWNYTHPVHFLESTNCLYTKIGLSGQQKNVHYGRE